MGKLDPRGQHTGNTKKTKRRMNEEWAGEAKRDGSGCGSTFGLCNILFWWLYLFFFELGMTRQSGAHL